MPAPEPHLPSSPITIPGDRRRRRTRGALGLLGSVLAVGAVVATVAVASGAPDDPTPVAGAAPVSTPDVTTTRSAEPAYLASIPEGFPLAAGYPDENEDRSPVNVTTKPGFKRVELCGTEVWNPTQPATPTDLAGVSYAGVEDFRARTLALYPDDATATSALQSIADGYGNCAKEHAAGDHQYYEVLSDDDDTVIVAHTYGPPGDGNLGVEMDQYARVGNALFLDSLYGESGTSDEALAGFAAVAVEWSRPVVDALETLVAGGTDDGGGTSAPAEEGKVPLDPQNLLMIDDLPAAPGYAAPWQEATDDTLTWACRPLGFGDLDADGSIAVRYQALTDDGSGNTSPAVRSRDAVLQFATPEAARAAYDQAVDHLKSCEADQGYSTDGKAIQDSTDAGASYLQGFTYLSPETCGDSDCDAAWFDYQGVTQNGDRLVLVSYAQVGGPLPPDHIRRNAQDVADAAASRSGL